jgi:uncharacterized protein
MDNSIIGRQKERQLLEQVLNNNRAEMVSVIGRRRVGKTFLVKSVFAGQIDFEITGVQHASTKNQLYNFAYRLGVSSQSLVPLPPPSNWLQAFQMLIGYLDRKSKVGKMVVFLDELPWLATPKSGFLEALGFFWNSWACEKNIVVVVCGSAASWMIQKVVHQKGGLYNRLTRRLELAPFNLNETEAFFQSRNVRLDRYQILQLYMTLGGIPHYLNEVEAGETATQSIEKICFTRTGLLNNEFSMLYHALFDYADNHIAVVRTLAKKLSGMTRREIIEYGKLANGGTLSNVLEELISSGFITIYYPFDTKKKETIYRLTDEYSLFYLQFMENQTLQTEGIWHELSQTQEYRTWTGFAFEGVCLKHVGQIKKALGISGIFANTTTFYKKGDENTEGVQIDLLIDRKDQAINLCELKFYNDTFSLTKAQATTLRRKISVFKSLTQTRKQVFLTMISSFPLEHNEHSLGLVDKAFSMDVLFDAL